ncbi:MAG TPA: hypothetical protein DHV62_06260 [Elusimicrobia bacterium]|jgi:DNA-binding NtrC family response regulator|nr:hypothetical protein [Elusimicrobiota bacterium]
MDNSQKRPILVCVHPESAEEILYSLLTNQNFQVVVAKSSSECLEKIHSAEFNALVIDADFLKMQNEVDIPLLRELTISLPVIVTAGKENLEIENKIREEEIFYYIVKPVEQKELIEAVEEAIKWSQRNK